ncbi:hypothetical protein HAX54_025927 [Datura stramonium]|uniref:Uncharacterized protein n=1 Tax=Datura stramonium TaxID=4076 RepID=A0ABS8V122_DATST|nr:hypothetical protein [Datura stramonium]
MDMKRKFLMSQKCLDELLHLEEESGNFTAAAVMAQRIGNVLCEADLSGKGGDYDRRAHSSFCVLSHSLWKGWKQRLAFEIILQKEELLKKAMTFLKHGSNLESMCIEIKCGDTISLLEFVEEECRAVLDSLECLGDVDFGEIKGAGEFCLKYFGVRQQLIGSNVTYVLLHPEAEWVKNIRRFVIRRNKQRYLVMLGIYLQLVLIGIELLVVGLKVLKLLHPSELAEIRCLYFGKACPLNVRDCKVFK